MPQNTRNKRQEARKLKLGGKTGSQIELVGYWGSDADMGACVSSLAKHAQLLIEIVRL